MNRSEFLNSILAAAVLVPEGGPADMKWKSVGGVAVPDTVLANEATSIAQSCEPVEIFNHSLRTYLFAEIIAKVKGISHDPELVYVASILHDTGLSTPHMSESDPFEVDGANVARDLLEKHGVAEARRNLVWDAVALHDNGGIARHKQTEVVLVNAGVGADFGGFADIITRDQLANVFSAAPRKKFVNVFLDAAAAVAKKKPLSTAHSFVADVGYCKVRGFSLPSFCDEVKDDPYAGY